MSTGVAILGSTGSIGKTALAVIRNMPGTFHVVGLAAGHRVGELEKQIREFSPGIVSVAAEADAVRLRKTVSRLEVVHGLHGAVMVADTPGADTVVAAIVGSDGLASTYRAVERASAWPSPTRNRWSWPADSLWGQPAAPAPNCFP